MSYKQLTQEERYQIHAYLKAGFNQTEIAMELNRHKSTISREIQRNRGLRGYRPQQAQRLTDERKQVKARRRISNIVWSDVRKLLRKDWSPEQISLWFDSEKSISISHEWIYQYILRDKNRVSACIVTYLVKNCAVNATAAIIVVASLLTVSALMKGLLLLIPFPVSATRNSTPSSVKTINKPSSH